MTGAIATRLARPADLPALAALFGEMERHYRPDLTVADATLAARADAALFGKRPVAEALLAEVSGRPVGFAFFSAYFPTVGGGTGALLKDLYVTGAARRRGVARALLRALAREAIARGWERIEFATGTDNDVARAAYAAIGAPLHDHVAYRFEGEALRRLASQS